MNNPATTRTALGLSNMTNCTSKTRILSCPACNGWQAFSLGLSIIGYGKTRKAAIQALLAKLKS